MTFKETLEKHLKAIEEKDIESLKETLPLGEELVLITPTGGVISSCNEFVDGHVPWFEDDSWNMTFETVNIIESSEMGIATVKYRYVDKENDSYTILSLAFKFIDGRWLLVHDQNTPIS